MPETPPACIYCGSADTEDCGDIGGGEHHIECHSCRWAFPWPLVPADGDDRSTGAMRARARQLAADPKTKTWLDETRRALADGSLRSRIAEQPDLDDLIDELGGDDAEHFAVQVTNMPPTEIVCKCGERFAHGDVLTDMKAHVEAGNALAQGGDEVESDGTD